jgi:predicted dehydrogenase
MNHLPPPIRLGVTGLGGYAGYVCDRALEDSTSPNPSAMLVAVAEPKLERFARKVDELRARGVTVVRDYAELLALDLEAVWLPLPIDLHLPYTEQGLAAGKAVMCEKPAAGCVEDVDRMIAARDAAGLPVGVGFQDLYQPSVRQLKQRLCDGEFGKPLKVSVIGCWPRSERYFGRNDWAGKLRRDGRWVMDSPAQNALAHFIHLSFFLLGCDDVNSTAQPTRVSAELYRANRIENYDTCSIGYTVSPGDVPVCVAFTHACAATLEPVITLECERATILYLAGRHIEVRAKGKGAEILPLAANPHKHMLADFAACVRDRRQSVASTLEMARAHVVAVNAASEAAPVVDVPVDFVDTVPAPDQTILRAVRNIVPALKACAADGCQLHETATVPWSHPAAVMPINGYHHFAGPAAAANGSRGGPRVQAKTFVNPAGKSAAAAIAPN